MTNRIALFAVVVPLVAAVIGLAGCGAGQRTDSTPSRPGLADGTPVSQAQAGPSGERFGVPVGWAHDAEHAKTAAATFVASSDLVATSGPLVRRDVLLTMATPTYGPALVESTAKVLDDLLFSFGERGISLSEVTWAEHPLTTMATAQSDDAVRVRVWSVVVIAAGDQSVPRQLWRTSTVEMRWTDGDWKVDDWATEDGPVPAPLAEVDVATAAEIVEVTSWPTAPREVQP